MNKVHFHEVGAMDAIIRRCRDLHRIRYAGHRTVCMFENTRRAVCRDGTRQIPGSAAGSGGAYDPALIYSTEIEGELITPTGAAIISTLCDSYGTIPEMMVEQSAYGAGTKRYEIPKCSAVDHSVEVGERKPLTNLEQLTLIETNIDDVSPQILGFVMERSFELSALDCWFTPVQMKKIAPRRYDLSMLCQADKKDVLTQLLYTETTTVECTFQNR
ncbi:MAG: DUF111 family protein [Acidobacteria bacterium]|nr:DUF111 family protein [Acidobacteriota bacterium]